MGTYLDQRAFTRQRISVLEKNAADNADDIETLRSDLRKIEKSLLSLDEQRIDEDIVLYKPDFELTANTPPMRLLLQKISLRWIRIRYSGGGHWTTNCGNGIVSDWINYGCADIGATVCNLLE